MNEHGFKNPVSGFWGGVGAGAATQTLVTCGAIIAGAPDRLWVPLFIACGAMLVGSVGMCRNVGRTHARRPNSAGGKQRNCARHTKRATL